ncbi:Predicted DNA-binding transcriptional regulator YafY, contains an HTH and WYL domains [Paenibacillus catalpae]|uniref:Predicted DNA-binding transcriptional regulator YafY, contains an HTH and WYL domains n=1 Tax=Paenibacillus catalpae TaxID=1045775 RepID=A0A1I1Y162_9BACL|nr:WYL domain-containing protein [Paenibacillus catalpae]SFE13284.1 Predicted DNA-binding transcriptional regulator YafY, contains an HTH and WYL domains [Paenibacillus catalpae]
MAKESFDKEIQFLRMLVLTSGAYNRQQFADRLGISVHTFDKTIRRLKDIAGTVQQQTADEQNKAMADMLRTSYYESADPLLLFLFRSKSLKESESYRLSLLIASLQEQSLTSMELLELCSEGMPGELALPDEKTIRSDLKYLEQAGVIRRLPGGRPQKYTAHNDFVTMLSDEELSDLYAFVDVMANTQVPSVQGYLLRDSLKKAMKRRQLPDGASDLFLYKYHYHSRILDEAHLYTIMQAIEARRKLSFHYFTPKSNQSYQSKNTNPMFTKESEGRLAEMLPLKIAYDHQYGRWYLLGYSAGRSGVAIFRMEGITQLEESGFVTEDEYMTKLASLERNTRYSWLVDMGRPVEVKVRFFNPDGAKRNFIKDRVLLQGQWGVITEEDDVSFLFEITVNGTQEIKPWLRSFGSSCEVLEPAALRREFIKEWKELAAYYEPVRKNIQLPDDGTA